MSTEKNTDMKNFIDRIFEDTEKNEVAYDLNDFFSAATLRKSKFMPIDVYDFADENYISITGILCPVDIYCEIESKYFSQIGNLSVLKNNPIIKDSILLKKSSGTWSLLLKISLNDYKDMRLLDQALAMSKEMILGDSKIILYDSASVAQKVYSKNPSVLISKNCLDSMF